MKQSQGVDLGPYTGTQSHKQEIYYKVQNNVEDRLLSMYFLSCIKLFTFIRLAVVDIMSFVALLF